MVYKGSKNRIAKYIVPILQKSIDEMGTGLYIEPFVGGANIIDKIKAPTRIGYDFNKYLISLLDYISNNDLQIDAFTEDKYKYVKNNKSEFKDWELGLYGFCGSYGSKFFDTFARGNKNNGESRDMPRERINNLKKQSSNLKDVTFKHYDFKELKDLVGYTIYCDIPYKGTSKYDDDFDYEYFYEWCKKMSINNNVFVSEYNMPFGKVVWSGELRSSINNASQRDVVIERLFYIEKEV